jgi:tripartite ATP-independent transporter DctM subunit
MHTVEHAVGGGQTVERADSSTLARGGWFDVALRIESYLGRGIELAAALLIVAEIVILFAGVISRYFLQTPLVWSDELASLLFLWLASLGAVVALRRNEHMRMTAIVGMASPRGRSYLEAISLAAAVAFLLLTIVPAYEFAAEEVMVTTPALEISNGWRAFALPTGLGLMALVGILQLISIRKWSVIAVGLGTLAVGGAILFAFSPLLPALGNLNLVIFFVVITGLLVFGGVPIAFSFGLATFAYLALTTQLPLQVLVGRMDEGMSHLILLAVPLFVFLGLLIEMAGMARAMVHFLASLLGHVRGGLSYVLVGAMYLVSGISGSKAADMAAVAPVLFPEMKKRGAKPGDLVALMSATGAQTETIPPSIVLITVGSVTGVSISALFTGGLLPGVVLAIGLCAVVWLRYRNEDLSQIRRASGKEILRALVVGIPALALPFVIRYSVVEGIATATEVSTLGIAYSLLVGLFIYRQMKWRRGLQILVETAALSGAILLIIGTATGMAWALTQSGFSGALARAMGTLPGGGLTFLFVSILAFVILGSVLEGIPAIVLFGPLLFPIARQMGVHEVHYAMVVILAMGIGLFSPPFGVGYYAACAIGRVNPDEGMKPIVGYVLAMLVGLVLIALVPWISIGFLK